MAHSLVNFDFSRSPSRSMCDHTRAACVCVPAPRGRPRECVVEELFTENHTSCRWGGAWGWGVSRVMTTCC